MDMRCCLKSMEVMFECVVYCAAVTVSADLARFVRRLLSIDASLRPSAVEAFSWLEAIQRSL